MRSFLCLCALLLVMSCSTEDAQPEQDLNSFTPEFNTNESKKPIGAPSPCTFPGFINEYAVPSATPYSYDIHWDNFFLMLDCDSMVGKIEIFADGVTDPNTNLPQTGYPYMGCYGNITTPINAVVPIDFFNTTTHTLTIPDFGTKCLWWRIVLEGKDCGTSNISCETATSWHFISTYDL